MVRLGQSAVAVGAAILAVMAAMRGGCWKMSERTEGPEGGKKTVRVVFPVRISIETI